MVSAVPTKETYLDDGDTAAPPAEEDLMLAGDMASAIVLTSRDPDNSPVMRSVKRARGWSRGPFERVRAR